jgi:hypothetical protein
VLHARIPEHLDEAIRDAANELGMSVSNLVRNVLANALDVVEAATARVPKGAAAAAATVRSAAKAAAADMREAAAREAGAGARDAVRDAAAREARDAAAREAAEPATVLGWQEAILNLNAVCEKCNAILPRGTRAGISVPDRASAQRIIRCQSCLEELTGAKP